MLEGDRKSDVGAGEEDGTRQKKKRGWDERGKGKRRGKLDEEEEEREKKEGVKESWKKIKWFEKNFGEEKNRREATSIAGVATLKGAVVPHACGGQCGMLRIDLAGTNGEGYRFPWVEVLGEKVVFGDGYRNQPAVSELYFKPHRAA